MDQAAASTVTQLKSFQSQAKGGKRRKSHQRRDYTFAPLEVQAAGLEERVKTHQESPEPPAYSPVHYKDNKEIDATIVDKTSHDQDTNTLAAILEEARGELEEGEVLEAGRQPC